MKKEEKIDLYERNQCRLIKALVEKIKENKKLKEENNKYFVQQIYMGTFLTKEEQKAAKMMAEAMLEREKEMMQQ